MTKRLSPAFINYLATLPKVQAVTYIWHCLVHGEKGNQAWALMEATHGSKWRLPGGPDAYDFLWEAIDKALSNNRKQTTIHKGENNESTTDG